jgi:hypothetical protein
MKLPFEFNLNAAHGMVTQMGSVLKSASGTVITLFKGWFTGDGPLSRLWSSVMSVFDVLSGKVRTASEEQPWLVLGVLAGAGVLLVLVGPGLLGKSAASAAKGVGNAVGGIIGGVKKAIASLWRS